MTREKEEKEEVKEEGWNGSVSSSIHKAAPHQIAFVLNIWIGTQDEGSWVGWWQRGKEGGNENGDGDEYGVEDNNTHIPQAA